MILAKCSSKTDKADLEWQKSEQCLSRDEVGAVGLERSTRELLVWWKKCSLSWLRCTLKNLYLVLFAKLTLHETLTIFGADISQPVSGWLCSGSHTRRASCDSYGCGHAANFLTAAWGGPSTWPISHPGTVLAFRGRLSLPGLSWGPQKTPFFLVALLRISRSVCVFFL